MGMSAEEEVSSVVVGAMASEVLLLGGVSELLDVVEESNGLEDRVGEDVASLVDEEVAISGALLVIEFDEADPAAVEDGLELKDTIADDVASTAVEDGLELGGVIEDEVDLPAEADWLELEVPLLACTFELLDVAGEEVEVVVGADDEGVFRLKLEDELNSVLDLREVGDGSDEDEGLLAGSGDMITDELVCALGEVARPTLEVVVLEACPEELPMTDEISPSELVTEDESKLEMLPSAAVEGAVWVSELFELLLVCELTVDDVVATSKEVELTSSLRQEIVP
ncbi:hypothetical protein CLAFUW4_02540 [Fulvia fulva]|nr:hypothetical protein CLAFUR4_02535 [Fulvia fulva]KAK4633406.1 hypothetical protein CLAFUR0_02539 [Fulvia fulva]WPV11086.1 hypothetical protein CLAFUW4_02540 [Fulvia fulva]WPV26858.1 hypothetical protein CLAFUW7_02540 [Fulvia fulva]